MTSLTRIAYGSVVCRHGRPRRTRTYQPSSAPRSASRSSPTSALSTARAGASNPLLISPSRETPRRFETGGFVGDALLAKAPAGALHRRCLVALDVGQLAPQLADLVTQPRRVLEAEILGRGEHLLLQLDDRLLHLGERHVLRLRAPALAAPPALGRLALGLQELGDVADALDDRRGGDAVLLVVGDLDRPAAVSLR